MDLLSLLGIVNYGLILLYGLLLSVQIVGGWQNNHKRRLVLLLYPLFLLLQGACMLLFGVSVTKQLYPFITHIPLILILVFILKKRVDMAVVSVCTAYLCCQLPRWINLLCTTLTGSALLGEISYTVMVFPIYFLLRRYFVRIAHDAMCYSVQNLFLFGSLPIVYYLFDYSTVIYTNALYAGTPALIEFFPTAIIVFYIGFITAYHAQTQKRSHAELQQSMLEIAVKQAETELTSLRQVENQTAIYQHNMRHHLNAIGAFLAVGNYQQADAYIKEVQTNIEAITPKRVCANELVNLLCSSFLVKANISGIQLTVNAKLPQTLSIPDTELCSALSNGLENALYAVSELDVSLKWVKLYCGIQANKFLMEIKNPYVGDVIMRDGIPVSARTGHGYGCQSIHSIAKQNGGLCSFQAEDGLFTLRIALPLHQAVSSPS